MNVLCLDTEHSKDVFKPWEEGFYLTCVSWKDNKGREGVIWVEHSEIDVDLNWMDKVQRLMDWADLIVMHNAKHDINVLKWYGIESDAKLHCTMLSEYLIRGQDKQMRWRMNDVAERYGLPMKPDKVKAMWDQGTDTYDIPLSLLEEYALHDANITMQIYENQLVEIKERNQEKLIAMQNEFTYSLADMEYNGFKLDPIICENIIKEHSELAEFYNNSILEIAEEPRINLNSHTQLSALLYGGILKLQWKEWKITECKTKPYSYYKEHIVKEEVDYVGLGFKPVANTERADGYFRTNKDTILRLSAPNKRMREIKDLLIKYSQSTKVIETLRGKSKKTGLLTKLQRDGCVHPRLNQTISATGRLTSSDPNGQNIPRGNTSPIKRAIRPTLEGILQVDLSQIEWRAAAWLSQDKVMIEEVNSGIDQHVATVRELMELEYIDKTDKKSKENRFNAKIFNFRMIFGGSEWGFFNDIRMPKFTISKWRTILQRFYEKYYGLAQYHVDIIKEGMIRKELTLPTGRWFKLHRFEEEIKDNHCRSWPVQGFAGGDALPVMAVIIRRGMKKLGLKSKLILTVHDSLVFDYLNSEKEVLIKLCYDVGNNLHKYISSYFGVNFNVKIECECEAGPSYGELTFEPRR